MKRPREDSNETEKTIFEHDNGFKEYKDNQGNTKFCYKIDIDRDRSPKYISLASSKSVEENFVKYKIIIPKDSSEILYQQEVLNGEEKLVRTRFDSQFLDKIIKSQFSLNLTKRRKGSRITESNIKYCKDNKSPVAFTDEYGNILALGVRLDGSQDYHNISVLKPVNSKRQDLFFSAPTLSAEIFKDISLEAFLMTQNQNILISVQDYNTKTQQYSEKTFVPLSQLFMSPTKIPSLQQATRLSTCVASKSLY